MIRILIISIFILSLIIVTTSDCTLLNNCNGHGVCDGESNTCNCYKGYGASSDITLLKAVDCSRKVCPSYKSWGQLPKYAADPLLKENVYDGHPIAECSDRGTCDGESGQCICFPGYSGAACQRFGCFNECSGHGMCMTMKQMGTNQYALPSSQLSNYGHEMVNQI